MTDIRLASSGGAIRRWWWLLPAAVGAGITLLIMVVLPADRTIDNLGEVLFKTAPLLCAVVAIAYFPQRPGLGLVLLGVFFAGYMGAVDTINVNRIFGFADAADHDAAFPHLYQWTIFLNAFVVLAALFAYRLGGATAGRVLRAGLAAVLVLISGLNDLTFYYSNDWDGPRPARLEWASHIAVFVGGPPRAVTAIAFCVVHLALAAVVLALPLGRWADRFDGWADRVGAGPAPVTGSAEPVPGQDDSVTGPAEETGPVDAVTGQAEAVTGQAGQAG